MMDQVDTISFKDMISWMDSGNAFSLSFVTYDRKRRKGGEWIEIKYAVKHHVSDHPVSDEILKIHPQSSYRCDPKHFENSTRNIRLMNGSIRKVHLRLIRIFNKKIVL